MFEGILCIHSVELVGFHRNRLPGARRRNFRIQLSGPLLFSEAFAYHLSWAGSVDEHKTSQINAWYQNTDRVMPMIQTRPSHDSKVKARIFEGIRFCLSRMKELIDCPM